MQTKFDINIQDGGKKLERKLFDEYTDRDGKAFRLIEIVAYF